MDIATKTTLIIEDAYGSEVEITRYENEGIVTLAFNQGSELKMSQDELSAFVDALYDKLVNRE